MRKHFLILMLLSLLPLAGWAATDIIVQATSFTVPFGNIPEVGSNATSAMVYISDDQGQDESAILNVLRFYRIDEGTAVSNTGYQFRIEAVNAVVGGHAVKVLSSQNVMYVAKADISDASSNATFTITGSTALHGNAGATPTATPAFTFKVGNETLVEGTDYSVEYSGNTTAGDNATITVTSLAGSTKLVGDKIASEMFTVGKRGIEDAVFTLKSSFQPMFTGSPITISTDDVESVTQDGVPLASTEWAIDTYTNNTEAGTTAKVIFKGAGGHDDTSTKELEFTIAQATSLDLVKVTPIPAVTYTGKTATPVVQAYIELGGNDAYDAGVDYLINLENDLQAVTTNQNATAANGATVTISSRGKNFAANVATKTVNYTINKLALDAANVRVKEASLNMEYNGGERKAQPTLVIFEGTPGNDNYHEVETIAASNYELSYTDGAGKAEGADGFNITNIQTGAKVKYTAKGTSTNFSGYNEQTYNITKKTLELTPFALLDNDEDTKHKSVGVGSDIPVGVYSFSSQLVSPDTEGTVKQDVDLGAIANYVFYNNVVTGGEDGPAASPMTSAPTAPGKYWYKLTDAACAGFSSNYAVSSKYAKLEIIKAEVFARVVSQNNVTFGTAPAEWTLQYVSGLAEDATDAQKEAVIGTSWDQNNFSYDATTMKNVKYNGNNIDSYTITYDATIANDNYTVTVLPGTLTIKPKNLNDLVSSMNFADQDYTGATVSPALTFTYAGGNYSSANENPGFSVAYDDADFNAGAHTATITATANGNFIASRDIAVVYYANATEYNAAKGTTLTDGEFAALSNAEKTKTPAQHFDNTVKTYTISPVALTITPAAQSTTYGNVPATFSGKTSYTATGLVGRDAEIDLTATGNAGFTAPLLISRICSNNVGVYAEGLLPSGLASPNYLINRAAPVAPATATADFSKDIYGKLTIGKGNLTVKIKDQTITYGAAPAAWQLEYVSGISDEELAASIDVNDVVIIVEEDKTIVGGAHLATNDLSSFVGVNEKNPEDASTGYDVTTEMTGKSNNYNIAAIQPGKLYINRKDITFTAKSVSKNYAEAKAYVDDAAVNDTYIEKTAGDYAYVTDEITDLIEAITFEGTKVGENAITLTAKTTGKAANYNINVVAGVLTVTGGIDDITFNRPANAGSGDSKSFDPADVPTNTAAQLIHDYNGEQVNVSFGDFAMASQKWYAMSLPFATSVKELSQKFGYAVVDILDADNASKNPHFVLHMGNIAANTPFLIKVYDATNLNVVANNSGTPGGIDNRFKEVEIVEPAANCEWPSDGYSTGNQFIGEYAGKIGFAANEWYLSISDNPYGAQNANRDEKGRDITEWKHGSDTNTTALRPLGAYVKTVDDGDAHIQFFIEEPDGSTTVINGVGLDGENGFSSAEGLYNLNGMKMNTAPTKKGVYIQNGKKVVVK